MSDVIQTLRGFMAGYPEWHNYHTRCANYSQPKIYPPIPYTRPPHDRLCK